MKQKSTERLLEWTERLKAQKLSNKGVVAWCEEQNISPNTFQYWKKKIKQTFPPKHSKNSFLELGEDSPIIEVSLQGIKLVISKDFDKNALINFLSLLK